MTNIYDNTSDGDTKPKKLPKLTLKITFIIRRNTPGVDTPYEI